MEAIGAATAAEMRATGLDWTFGPTLTVPQDTRWGRTYEGYSEDPQVVASYAAPIVRGLQGKPGGTDFLRPPHVIATAKHFLGDGGTTNGKDQGDTRVDETDPARQSTRPATCRRWARASCRSWPRTTAGTARRCTAIAAC